MALSLIDIIKLKYPGEVEKGNISFNSSPDGLTVSIKTWNVPNIERPIESDLMLEEPQWEKPFQIKSLFENAKTVIYSLLNSTAQAKQYENAVSCASYIASSNDQWRAEAQAFINWRDAVFVYAISIQTAVEQDAPVPTLDEFIAGLPAIQWPN